MRQFLFFFLTLCILIPNLNAQTTFLAPTGGGPANLEVHDEITDAERKEIQIRHQENIKRLQIEGIIDTNAFAAANLLSNFQWPLRQAAGFNYNSYYGVSNFVDHNLSYPNVVKDYNCGTRTYDTNGGYNHQGTDIFLWPFAWDMVDANQVEIIAGAAGVIIDKRDGNYDKNCSFTGAWNAVYIQHSDGSIAWYGHMKNGSLTTKGIGASVAAGEYLGVVGSSGYSTGPHLHLEIWSSSSYTQLLDPYLGDCNGLNNSSLWDNQKPYFESTLNAILTHSDIPKNNRCYPDESNISNNFDAGDFIYFASYHHDQLDNQPANYKIYQPNNTLWISWDYSSTYGYLQATSWYWRFPLPTNAQNGQWRFEVTYQGKILNHYFNVGVVSCPNSMTISDNLANYTYEAAQTIQTSGNVNITGTGVFKAGQSITLTDGFHAKANCNFTALIASCSNLTQQTPSEDRVAIQEALKIEDFQLAVFPNPFTHATNISLSTSNVTNFSLAIYNSTGQLVEILDKSTYKQKGNYTYQFVPQNLPKGIYFLLLKSDKGIIGEKIILN